MESPKVWFSHYWLSLVCLDQKLLQNHLASPDSRDGSVRIRVSFVSVKHWIICHRSWYNSHCHWNIVDSMLNQGLNTSQKNVSKTARCKPSWWACLPLHASAPQVQTKIYLERTYCVDGRCISTRSSTQCYAHIPSDINALWSAFFWFQALCMKSP